MIRLKVSYEHRGELTSLVQHLGRWVKRIKEPVRQEGRFRKVYIELQEPEKT